MASGRESRKSRLIRQHPGVWSTSSQDFIRLVNELFESSAREAQASDGNESAYVFAGLPLLFSGVRAFLIECGSGVYGNRPDPALLRRLANEQNELSILEQEFRITEPLSQNLSLLYEARNEIIHPSHRPTGAPDSTPDHLRPLKERGVLQSTNSPQWEFVWMNQLQSHRLFEFALATIASTVEHIIQFYQSREPLFRCNNLHTYRRHVR